ncbi:IS30 family transposase [Granulicella aggregans]|uniref:IS30 family transposase n=1 Tax=Granulicella aggregans TaxID=474949 RepID=A0A7W7ZFB0_9BACT|nr:hypothetical protein [Granulicella aggregans]MBB5058854.1 IS30 family transposase [Granulicella aggregans]
MLLIDEVPSEADLRVLPDNWGSDVIIGKGNRSEVGAPGERTTLFVELVRLGNAKAPNFAARFSTLLNGVDSQMPQSLTREPRWHTTKSLPPQWRRGLLRPSTLHGIAGSAKT